MDALQAHDEWRAARHAYVSAPVGNIALVGYQSVFADREPVEEWPAQTYRLNREEGVHIVADGAAGVRVDGELIDGDVFVGRLRGNGKPLLTWQAQAIDVFSLDGSDYELRRYDSQAEALSDFVGIDTYPYDPALAMTGQLRPYEQTATMAWAYTRESDSGHTKQVPGLLAVTLAGEDVELLAFRDHDALVLTFSDSTTGAESYAPGRFLKLDAPGADGVVAVDFNRTIIPPCGFSSFYSCPLPPAQNRLKVPVRAGERRVQWKSERH